MVSYMTILLCQSYFITRYAKEKGICGLSEKVNAICLLNDVWWLISADFHSRDIHLIVKIVECN